MMNLKNSLSGRFSNKILLRVMAIIALIGVADTAYLTADYYFGTGVQCLLLEGCKVVLTSSYSVIMGIPLVVFGLVFYTVIFILVNLTDLYGGRFFQKILALVGVAGFVASLFFLYLQVFVIGELCFYCLVSLGSSTSIFILAALFSRNLKL